MKLSEVKNSLKSVNELHFRLPDKSLIPVHFHVTEIGLITKNFIDCGGTVRNEKLVNFQFWEANDIDHRLAPQKLMKIIELSEKELGIEDFEVEVEYQTGTIGKYGLEFNGKEFLLTCKHTNCLAKDNCGVSPQKKKINISELVTQNSCCTSDSTCC
jgi:hypothetical protein